MLGRLQRNLDGPLLIGMRIAESGRGFSVRLFRLARGPSRAFVPQIPFGLSEWLP